MNMTNIFRKFTVPAVIISILSTSTTFAYSDLKREHLFYDEIAYLENSELLPEEFGDNFQPEKKITRSELYAMIFSYTGAELPTNSEIDLPFEDVHNLSVYAKYIQAGLDKFIIRKPMRNKKFSPDKVMKKRETIQILFSSLGIGVDKFFDKSDFPFKDISKDSLFAPYAYAAYKTGIIDEEYPTSVRAAKSLTRGEVAGMIYQIDENKGKSGTVTIRLESKPSASSTSFSKTEKTLIENEKFDILLDVWAEIQDSYLYQKEIDEENMIYEAIDGMVNYLEDQHTVFTKPTEENSASQLNNNEYEGIGVSVEMVDDDIKIVSPFKNSPAEKAGLKPGDIIKKVDGKSITGLTLPEVTNLIKGPSGSEVKLIIKRGTKNQTISIERGYILYHTASLDWKAVPDGQAAVISILTFSQDTLGEFLKAAQLVEDRQKSHNDVKGIVLDLRNNPGGYLDVAIDMAGFFFDSKKTMVILEEKDGKKTSYKSDGTGLLADYKTVVLVNAGSASASEIVAGALQDWNRAKIFGEQSYGKGTVQELATYADGSAFKLTVAKWLTPKGHSINGKGVTPDRKLTNSNGTDWQLDTALEEF